MGLRRVNEVTPLSQRWIENLIYSPLTSVQPVPAAPYLRAEEFAGPQITATPGPGGRNAAFPSAPQKRVHLRVPPRGLDPGPGRVGE